LMYADKLSMAHSLEVRVTYLAREIVEFVECLDASFKVRNGRGKWVHRQVCKDFLPPSILQRKKRGFAVNVVDSWFKETMAGKFREMLTDSQSLMFAFLKSDSIMALIREHEEGKSDNHKVLFSLVAFEEWLRNGGTLHVATQNIL